MSKCHATPRGRGSLILLRTYLKPHFFHIESITSVLDLQKSVLHNTWTFPKVKWKQRYFKIKKHEINFVIFRRWHAMFSYYILLIAMPYLDQSMSHDLSSFLSDEELEVLSCSFLY